MAFRECNHILADGLKCKSPALNRQSYCYFHHRYYQRQRRRIQLGGPVGENQNTGIEMPIIENWETIQIGIQEIIEAIVDNRINSKRAGLMLYALQLASTNLRMMKAPGISQPTGVTELPEDADPDDAPHLPQSADVGTTTPDTAPNPSTALESSTTPDPCHPERSADPPREAEGPLVSPTRSPAPTASDGTPPPPQSADVGTTNPSVSPCHCDEPSSPALARRRNDPLESLRKLYPGHCDETLVRFLPRPNDDETRLYFKDGDSLYAQREIMRRRALLGISH